MRNRAVAIIVMIILIAVSLPLGVHNSLKPLLRKAENEFSYDQTGYSIYDGISTRSEQAENILKVAEKYTSKERDLLDKIDELERSVKMLEYTYSLDKADLATYNKALDAPTREVADMLTEMDIVSDTEKKAVANALDEMRSQQYKIDHSTYNEKAQAYNEKLEQFPVNVLRHAAFLEPLELFV